MWVDWRPLSGVASTGSSCQVAGHQTQRGGQLSPQEFTVLLKDTVAGARIFCAVDGGGTFAVDALLDADGASLEVNIPQFSANNTEDNPATGTAIYSSPETAGPYSSHPEAPCTFFIEQGSNEQVVEGRVWVSFECSDMADASINSSCQIGRSYFAFQNCAK